MVIILIRHADDEGRNQKHRHDQEITPEGRKYARHKSRKLINHYGAPDIVYCTPMMRGKQTLYEMLRVTNRKPQIIIDNRVSRYFSSREKEDASIFTVTNKNNIPIKETRSMFKVRCDGFIKELISKGLHKSKKIIWVVTHTLVIKRITRKLHMRIHFNIDFLQHYRIKY